MAIITDKTVKSKYAPKQTNVTWIDTSSNPPVTKNFINGKWVATSSGGGTTDYEELDNKPSINNITLGGNKTAEQLGLQSELVSGTNIKTINGESVLGSGDIVIQGDEDRTLTFTAQQANSTVGMERVGSPTPAVLQYSTDDGETWNDYTLGSIITLSGVGDTVKFKGTNTTLGTDEDNNNRFVMTGLIAASGDVTSLLNETGGDCTLQNYAFCYLFMNCTSLTTAPKLPSITLADYCYNSMFKYCSSLTAAPALPASTLAESCYENMFSNCTSLTTAPALPATSLATYCYSAMFYGCTSLTTAPTLPATTLASYCYHNMFSNCSSLTTAPKLQATSLASNCYQNMFFYCTSLTTAPTLPAMTLVNTCYQNMFSGCTQLNYIKAMFTTAPSATYTRNWVQGVAATGTFVKNTNATWTTSGDDGVPTGWTTYKTVALDTDDVPESYIEDEGKTLQVVDGVWTKVTPDVSGTVRYDTQQELTEEQKEQAKDNIGLQEDLSELAPKNSPILTGIPEAPTAPFGTNSSQLATTEFVMNVVNRLNGGFYGIAYNEVTDVAPDAITRIGKLDWHKTLPIQSGMRRCLLLDNGTVNYYLDPNDSTKKADGTPAVLDGTDGQVMVEVPEHWRYVTIDENDNVVAMVSPYEQTGWIHMKKYYVSAYEAALDRTNLKLSSVMNTTAQFRGGNNTSGWDGTYRSLLGMPATNISLANFRTYARNRGISGEAKWNAYPWDIHNDLYWLYVIEYANRNSQASFNETLTAEGYRQGGLGEGVTNIAEQTWTDHNSKNPFIPCGTTNSLGNKTGVVSYDVMDSDGTTTLLTTYVPSWRGIENPFGHIWKNCDGIKYRGNGTNQDVLRCDDPANYSSEGNADNYTNIGTNVESNGYKSKILFGSDGYGDINCKSITGGGQNSHYADYNYQAHTDGTFYACFVGGGGVRASARTRVSLTSARAAGSRTRTRTSALGFAFLRNKYYLIWNNTWNNTENKPTATTMGVCRSSTFRGLRGGRASIATTNKQLDKIKTTRK